MTTPTVSIIIRTKNEERWISSCLFAVFQQEYKDFEVIIVDNQSTDRTLAKARQFDVKIVTIDEFKPGEAINLGIENSTGKYISCLSGHCIPTNRQWLQNLVANISPKNIAGVYGRQEPLSFSSDLDKRDLLIAFGLDRKIQKNDPFFHNANSLFKRELWEKFPFDDQLTNIEDRVWASKILRAGYSIIYEPSASVFHHHGIHQNLDRDRCRNIVNILETMEESEFAQSIDISQLNITAVIPVKGEMTKLGDRFLLEYTLDRVKESSYIKHLVLASDNPDCFDLAKDNPDVICLKRPESLSMEYIEIEDVLKYTLEKLEEKNILPDIVISLSITYPFRPAGFLDNMLKLMVSKGYDCMLPAIAEHRSCWREDDENGEIKRIDQGFIPSKFKNPIHIGISGLGTAVYAEYIQRGERLGPKVGLYELDELLFSVDVGKMKNYKLAETVIDSWWKENKG
jgi:rhamnosyltransferase